MGTRVILRVPEHLPMTNQVATVVTKAGSHISATLPEVAGAREPSPSLTVSCRNQWAEAFNHLLPRFSMKP